MTEQLELTAALSERDRVLDRLAQRDADWSARAYAAVLVCAWDHGEFISDQVWSYIDKPANPKALGPVLMRLAKEHRIVPTGALRPHPKRHATKTLVWRAV